MKKSLIIIAIFMMIASLSFAQTYTYVKTINTTGNESSSGVALTPDGKLYYVTFTGATSHVYYIENAFAYEEGVTAQTLVSTEALPAGRGLNDIEIDSAGNVYIHGTGGDANDTVLKKLGPAPTHTEIWSMQTLAAEQRIRCNGIELIDADTLAIAKTWNAIDWKNTSDGLSKSSAVAGGDSYHRSLALNTSNNDIYVGKNGSSTLYSLKVFTGGSPSNLTGYADAGLQLLPTFGNATATASATQAIDFDTNNQRLIACDAYDQSVTDTNQGVGIFSIAGSGATTVLTEVQYINKRSIDDTTGYGSANGVVYQRVTPTVGGTPRDVIAFCGARPGEGSGGGALYVIDIYQVAPSNVDVWSLY